MKNCSFSDPRASRKGIDSFVELHRMLSAVGGLLEEDGPWWVELVIAFALPEQEIFSAHFSLKRLLVS